MTLSIDEMAAFCKRKGFVYPASSLYGGLAGMFDYGPLGAELKSHIKQAWWRYHVWGRRDMTGMDGAIITHKEIWNASGHLDGFNDIILVCSKCKHRVRGDHFIEDNLNVPADGMSADDINELLAKHNLSCPKCKSAFQEAHDFNLMFPVNLGAEAEGYLRGETAQVIFSDFKLVADNARLKLPFGIAQIGKAFRNEISPRNFLFRCREFEQMEIEYFVHPEKINECPYLDEVKEHTMLVYSAEMQEAKKDPVAMSVASALDQKIIQPWHAYWLAVEHTWFIENGACAEHFRIRQHLANEKSHYATDTWDLEYKFPFGWKELMGLANRSDYDLKRHSEFSKKEMSLHIDGEKIVPHVVAEPSLGVERAFLVFLFDAYKDDKERGNIVLRLHPELAPVKVCVLPLMKKDTLDLKAISVFNTLKKEFHTGMETSGSVGRRYARNDEIGTPYCVTIDYQTLEDGTVTVRDRDSTDQIRVSIEHLKETLRRLLAGELKFHDAGPKV